MSTNYYAPDSQSIPSSLAEGFPHLSPPPQGEGFHIFPSPLAEEGFHIFPSPLAGEGRVRGIE